MSAVHVISFRRLSDLKLIVMKHLVTLWLELYVELKKFTILRVQGEMELRYQGRWNVYMMADYYWMLLLLGKIRKNIAEKVPKEALMEKEYL